MVKRSEGQSYRKRIEPNQPEAYVTLVATDNYVQGAIVLAYSIRNVGTTKLLICLVTPEIGIDNVTQLSKVFDHVLPITKLDTQDEENLKLLGRPELGLTVSKIHIWSLTWLDTILFLDADTLILKSLDHLFDEYRSIPFAACPDPGWPDCFNSGVFICKPSYEVYSDLMSLLTVQGSFDGGDQGLLNSYFSDWSTSSEQRMPFIYNCTPNAVYSYAPAYKKHSQDIAVMHFIGKDKPWDQEPVPPNSDGGTSTETSNQEQSIENNSSRASNKQITKEILDESELSEKLSKNLQDKQVELFKSDKNSDEEKLETIESDGGKLGKQEYIQKWWNIYRDNIASMDSVKDSLVLQTPSKPTYNQERERFNQEEFHSKSDDNDTNLPPEDITIKLTTPTGHTQQYETKSSNLVTNHSTEFDSNKELSNPQIHQKSHHTTDNMLSENPDSRKDFIDPSQLDYAFGSSDSKSTQLPFRKSDESIKLNERPILPEGALSRLAEHQMLTPAHQEARNAHIPFPLFEAYREPRRPRREPQATPNYVSGQPPVIHSESGPSHLKSPSNENNNQRRDLSPTNQPTTKETSKVKDIDFQQQEKPSHQGSTTNAAERSPSHQGSTTNATERTSTRQARLTDRRRNQPTTDATSLPREQSSSSLNGKDPEESFYYSASGTWTPVNREVHSKRSSIDSTRSSAPPSSAIIDKLLADTVATIPSDSPVSIKLTCTRSRSRRTSNGSFSTTYKLVWEESDSRSPESSSATTPHPSAYPSLDHQSLPSISGIVTPTESDSDNESVESQSTRSHPADSSISNSLLGDTSNDNNLLDSSSEQDRVDSSSDDTAQEDHNERVGLDSSKEDTVLGNSDEKLQRDPYLGSTHCPMNMTKIPTEEVDESAIFSPKPQALPDPGTIRLRPTDTIPNELPFTSLFTDPPPHSLTDSPTSSPSTNPPLSSLQNFGTYRISWDQPELQNWQPPPAIPLHARYRDSEDPHDRNLRRKSLASDLSSR